MSPTSPGHELRGNARFAHWLAAALLIVAGLPAGLSAQVRVATDFADSGARIQGRVVLIEPDIELTLVTAGGLHEPRREWSETARRLYPRFARQLLENAGAEMAADYDVPDDLDPASRLGQVVRLNEAVALSIGTYSQPGSKLATKGRNLDWTLGGGTASLAEATGADYGLFTYVRDSYSSGGRVAMRVLGLLAGAAVGAAVDIGGGAQIGVATLVDLRTGRVVWFNLLVRESGDLRDEEGAEKVVSTLLKGLPL